ncbi:transcriptional regulator [Brevibacillus laterosporus]|uniref:LexA family protein n=2 Tax=Brevibacillus laterosporus TaxID=1465 RepID=UPI0030B9E7C5
MFVCCSYIIRTNVPELEVHMRKLSPRKLQVFKEIKTYTDEMRYSPTVRELCNLTGIKSTSTMHRHLDDLRKMGVLTWDEGRPRTLTISEGWEKYVV